MGSLRCGLPKDFFSISIGQLLHARQEGLTITQPPNLHRRALRPYVSTIHRRKLKLIKKKNTNKVTHGSSGNLFPELN